MAWSNVGFDGTITEIEWSKLSSNLGNGYIAASNGDCVVTAVGGARSVSVAAGALYGDGVLSTNSAPETVALTTPVNGQWYVIALRRTWSTNTSALVAIAGATTTTTTPTAPPSTLPTLNTNTGVLTDQPIAWAWCNSANTTVVVFDMRLFPMRTQPTPVASAVARDAKFQSPTQGTQVWRDDLGAIETYYGLYNASTNPGGRDTAGWYVTTRQAGMRPIQPASVVIASGSGSANSLGVISFTNATSVSLNNVFSGDYRNYKFILQFTAISSAGTGIYGRLRAGGTDNSGAGSYFRMGRYYQTNNTGSESVTNGDTAMNFGDHSSSAPHGMVIGDIISPFPSGRTFVADSLVGYSGGWHTGMTSMHKHNVDYSADGITFYCGGGNMSGTVQILGYSS